MFLALSPLLKTLEQPDLLGWQISMQSPYISAGDNIITTWYCDLRFLAFLSTNYLTNIYVSI